MRTEKRIKPFMKWLESEWKNSPDQRFGQLLVNLGVVQDGRHWHTEVSSTPIPHEAMRGIQTWGTRYKNQKYGMNRKQVFIKDLETDHIKAILKTQKQLIDTPFEKILKTELKFRKNLKKMEVKNAK